ncbi:class I SAM-dependent methyltransferase [Effusibacillus lacus]|uniref:S-adenosyl-L-methionine-dependent methyltransferase n=2 Tax=Effusibacillus lacus TaxID=1348429 RepID=A0A292YC80_9BACL|nr:class I SAM-dependent methyltransferase [Effusibacillus lacus]TCS68561.1 methyltransferase (TIGR00027 family) [Effusibacillus lacus]GAX88852.1 methyltransferase [Effusibacillus lacus]
MKENQVSLTAIMTAYIRALHAMNDAPKIFDDFLAYSLIPEERRVLIEQGFTRALQLNDPEGTVSYSDQTTTLASLLQAMGLPNVLSRSRYTEDNLEQAVKQGMQQYVILGAGMDTFAFRRPDLLGQLQVFEVDHPATQAFKRNRLAELGWEIPPNLHFIPVDFSKESLAEALKGLSYDPQTKSFFSWLGVTMYLTQDEVFATLRSITDIAPIGSTIIFDYFEPEEAAPHMQEMREDLRKIGEPIKTTFDPSTLALDLASLGYRLHENLSPSDIQERYFQGRTDGYYACEHVHFAQAVVE